LKNQSHQINHLFLQVYFGFFDSNESLILFCEKYSRKSEAGQAILSFDLAAVTLESCAGSRHSFSSSELDS
jgi:hypothetical protein